jgi:DNA-binding Xre family transcriptional regulator
MLLDSVKLRKLRVKKRLFQFELANAIKLTQSSLSKYEKANCTIKFSILLSLCNYFNVEPTELLVDGHLFTPPREFTSFKHAYK